MNFEGELGLFQYECESGTRVFFSVSVSSVLCERKSDCVVCVVLWVCLHECKCIKYCVVCVCNCMNVSKMAITHEPCHMYTVHLTHTHTHTQVSETQEEAIVHALDCIEMMSVGHPARDKSCSQGW